MLSLRMWKLTKKAMTLCAQRGMPRWVKERWRWPPCMRQLSRETLSLRMWKLTKKAVTPCARSGMLRFWRGRLRWPRRPLLWLIIAATWRGKIHRVIKQEQKDRVAILDCNSTSYELR